MAQYRDEIFVATDAETFFLENVQSLPFGVAVKTGDYGSPLVTAAVILLSSDQRVASQNVGKSKLCPGLGLALFALSPCALAFQCCGVVFDGYSLSH